MLRSKYKEALTVAEDATVLFKANGFIRNQGSACMLCADAHRALEKYKESQKAALEAGGSTEVNGFPKKMAKLL